MTPVLIQTLMKKNKGKFSSKPLTKEEIGQANNVAAKFILWFIAGLFFTGLFLA